MAETIAYWRARAEAAEAKLARARRIIDLYFAPWGAAKAAEWEFEIGDIAFTSENAMRAIQKALTAIDNGAEDA